MHAAIQRLHHRGSRLRCAKAMISGRYSKWNVSTGRPADGAAGRITERIITAGIEHHNLGEGPVRLQALDQAIGRDHLVLEDALLAGADSGHIDRDEVVRAVDLDAAFFKGSMC